MSGNANLLQNLPSLAAIVDRQPSIVEPDMLAVEAIALMSRSRGQTCLLPVDREPESLPEELGAYSSSVLIVERERLVGIFTDRDAVRLAASQTDLEGVKIAAVMTATLQTLVLSERQTVTVALAQFQQYHIRHLPIVDESGRLVGIVTPERIRQILQPVNLLRFQAVAEVMTSAVISAAPTTSMLHIAQMMVEHNISSIVIADDCQSPHPLGIITERDLVRAWALELDLNRIQAETLMVSAPLFCLQPSDSLWAAQQLLQAKQMRQAVVTNDRGELVGILTQSDLLKLLDPLEMLDTIERLQQQTIARTLELEQRNRELQLEVSRRQQLEAELETQVRVRTSELALRTQQLQDEIAKHEFQKSALERLAVCDSNRAAIVAIADRFGKILDINDLFCQISQYSRSELLALDRPLVPTGDGTPASIERVWATIASGQIWRGEIANLAKDGSEYWLATTIVPFLDAEGQPLKYLAIGFDITELRAGERKIKEQAALLDIATDGILVRDLQGQVQFWNGGAETIYGWSAAEAIGRTTTELFYPDPLLAVEAIAARDTVLECGAWQGELVKLSKSGRKVIVESRWTLVRDELGRPRSILSVDTDITEKKSLEQQFLRAQRLESLGSLASGIAHDLNNVLTPILGAAQLLPMTTTNLDERSHRLLNMLVDSSKRGSALVKQILTFARGMDGQRNTIQVRHILAEIISVARQTFPKSIEIGLEIDEEELWLASVDPTQIHQILMNLFVNARDAMPDGGTLWAKAENATIADPDADRLNLPPGSYLKITIADTGQGMSAAVLDRIFDPFFTTKTTGTGLGLSTVLGIVKAHGGTIDVRSTVGRGSWFEIYLPALESRDPDLQTADDTRPDGKGRLILVVDDELAVRDITKEALETYNYRVLIASDAIEAIDIYAKNHTSIDTILIDRMMPNLDTRSAIQILQRIEPNVKIVEMSGLADRSNALPDGVKAFLSKPFTTAELLQALASV